MSVMVTDPVRNPTWVGLKVTLMKQLAPAATVAPQDFVTVLNVKSLGLTVRLLMFSVAVPVLVRVTVLVAGLPTSLLPHVSEAGTRLTTGPPPVAFTVSDNVVECVRLPDTPVMVTVEVPVAAVALAARVNVLLAVVGFGLNAAVTPLGRPEALKFTLPVNPFSGATVMVLVALLP